MNTKIVFSDNNGKRMINKILCILLYCKLYESRILSMLAYDNSNLSGALQHCFYIYISKQQSGYS